MKPILDCKEFVDALQLAINNKDKKQILVLYDANDVDWDNVNNSIGDKYEELVDIANDILM